MELYNPPKPYFKMSMKDLKKHMKKCKKLDKFFKGNYNKPFNNKSYKKLFGTRKRKQKMKILKKTRKHIKLKYI